MAGWLPGLVPLRGRDHCVKHLWFLSKMRSIKFNAVGCAVNPHPRGGIVEFAWRWHVWRGPVIV